MSTSAPHGLLAGPFGEPASASGPRLRRRLLLVGAGGVLVFGAWIARLAHLTLVEGEALAARAARARVMVEIERPPRGRILDRRGRVLAWDRPVYRVAVRLGEVDRGPEVSERVARWLREPRLAWWARWQALRAQAAADPQGPPLELARAKSAPSRRMLARLCRDEDGLALQGDRLFVERGALLAAERAIRRLAALAGLDEEEALARVERARERALAREALLDRQQLLDEPLVLAAEVPFETAARLAEEAAAIDGVVVLRGAERDYPEGPLAAHVVGHLGPLDGGEAARLRAERALLSDLDGGRSVDAALAARARGRFIDDRVGREGLERAYEERLRGQAGVRVVERERRAEGYRLLFEAAAEPGEDVHVALDAALQDAVERTLDAGVAAAGAAGGAVVVIDAETGLVYALASSPRYHPGRLGLDFDALVADPRRPLFHRALGALPPGSTVKPLTALFALACGVPAFSDAPLDLTSHVHCRGYLHSWRRFKCNRIHGDVGLEEALAASCNIYFYRAGEALGEEGLLAAFAGFGLGAPTGIDLVPEPPGRLPSTATKQQRAARAERRAREAAIAALAARASAAALAWAGDALGGSAAPAGWREAAARAAHADRLTSEARRLRAEASWLKGDSRNTAIGQGEVTATPLQVARAAAALQNGGRLLVPRLVPAADVEPAALALDLGLDPVHLAAVRRGMRQAVTSAGGTARRSTLEKRGPLPREALAAFLASAHVKTGTAEAPGGSHAWVMGFTDADPATGVPALAFAVALERVAEGVHGGDGAGPVAVAILAAARAALTEASP